MLVWHAIGSGPPQVLLQLLLLPLPTTTTTVTSGNRMRYVAGSEPSPGAKLLTAQLAYCNGKVCYASKVRGVWLAVFMRCVVGGVYDACIGCGVLCGPVGGGVHAGQGGIRG